MRGAQAAWGVRVAARSELGLAAVEAAPVGLLTGDVQIAPAEVFYDVFEPPIPGFWAA